MSAGHLPPIALRTPQQRAIWLLEHADHLEEFGAPLYEDVPGLLELTVNTLRAIADSLNLRQQEVVIRRSSTTRRRKNQ